ncbi:endolytic transglycosylase MltG [Apibacter muscae]|uniref:endolytic transglycosylase MltG n=1 Tax=Apibacter muscae TaxID=2509004 RepID=UPI0011ADE8AA|nr:endolytic transglycosylase MltG [Apibacter muscae]TWP31005.1 endolytic transglycosylase MltG [Apibacter muscae]
MNKKKIIPLFYLILIIIAFLIGKTYYKNSYSSNVKNDALLYIPTNATFEDVKVLINPYLKNIQSFENKAISSDYPNKIKAGRFKIEKGETNKEVINRLLLGKQEEVHLRIRNYDDIYELASDLGKNLEADSIIFLNYFKKEALEKGFPDVEELKIYFTPETYFVNWNTSPEKLFARFEKNHNNFWTEERLNKAKKLNLSKLEVYTLASIVQREYMKKEELPIISSLYLNRLNKGMKLQSDPTVIYAERKKQGFKVMMKRVKNISIDSPYNTYKYKGLPPLPICIPNDIVVDAVLNPANTNYLFMCAIKNTGMHAFTADDKEHMLNAKKYRQWLDSIGIK